MEDNRKLKKQYKLDFDTFRSGYEYFQKKKADRRGSGIPKIFP